MNNCAKCKADEVKEEDGICPYILGNDRLPLRCIGFWAKDKLYYLQRYMSIFNSSMKDKWFKRAYVELFAGPGLGIVRDSGQIISGSPLLAVEQPVAFSRHIFVDINKAAVEALEKRVKQSKSSIDVNFINGDCNDSIGEIRTRIDASYLILTFIDPTSMQTRFSAINDLTTNLHMDLIINFPLQAINRSYSYAMQGYERKFDDFFGTNEWKSVLNDVSDTRSAGAKLLDLYKGQLKKIGYGQIKDLSSDQQIASGDILVRGPKNIPLYYLIFASRSKIACKFWDEIQKTQANSQRRLL
ncbi:MAG: three-Cys-motif partner protein TcmP [Dehalococcoidales bacterium]